MVCRELNVPMALHGLSLDVTLILILFSACSRVPGHRAQAPGASWFRLVLGLLQLHGAASMALQFCPLGLPAPPQVLVVSHVPSGVESSSPAPPGLLGLRRIRLQFEKLCFPQWTPDLLVWMHPHCCVALHILLLRVSETRREHPQLRTDTQQCSGHCRKAQSVWSSLDQCETLTVPPCTQRASPFPPEALLPAQASVHSPHMDPLVFVRTWLWYRVVMDSGIRRPMGLLPGLYDTSESRMDH